MKILITIALLTLSTLASADNYYARTQNAQHLSDRNWQPLPTGDVTIDGMNTSRYDLNQKMQAAGVFDVPQPEVQSNGTFQYTNPYNPYE
jgi:hypothetical protein